MSDEEQLETINEIPDQITTLLPYIRKKALEIKAVKVKRTLSEEQFQMVKDEVYLAESH